MQKSQLIYISMSDRFHISGSWLTASCLTHSEVLFCVWPPYFCPLQNYIKKQDLSPPLRNPFNPSAWLTASALHPSGRLDSGPHLPRGRSERPSDQLCQSPCAVATTNTAQSVSREPTETLQVYVWGEIFHQNSIFFFSGQFDDRSMRNQCMYKERLGFFH